MFWGMTPAETASACPLALCQTRDFREGHTLVRPAIVAELTLPGPEGPARSVGLVVRNLGRKPLLVEGLLGAGVPVRVILHVSWRAETELSDNGRGLIVAVAVGSAGVFEICRLGDGHGAVVLQVSVVVVCHEYRVV